MFTLLFFLVSVGFVAAAAASAAQGSRCAPSMGAILEVKVLPKGDHSQSKRTATA